ncbi:MAG: AarF/UbiB family protein [Mariprofundus sp.]|nr:AarF/UbiB family protein [Mariprofundus sp.]
MKTVKRAMYLLHSAWLLHKIRRSKKAETRIAAQQRLTELLASKRGIGMKIGQAMAGMDDQSAFTELTQSVQAWPLSAIIPVLEAQWKQPLDSVLDHIDESFTAASLGQVHKARRCKQQNKADAIAQPLAIKVQYPDIRQAITSELSLANMLPKAGPVKRWNFDLDGYQETLSKTLLDELNYRHEMQQQQYFKRSMTISGLLVPEVYAKLCTEHVLVQQWVDGERLSEAANYPNKVRQKLAETVMQTLWQSLFELGLVHGDPHPGNLLFQNHPQQPKLVLLDYGCMVSIPERRRMALLHIIQGVRGKTALRSFDAFVGLGFDAVKLEAIKEHLDELARILFQPFAADSPFDTKNWQLSEQVATLFGDKRWLFRSAAPADLFLIIRIFQGLVSQLECLATELCWSAMLEQALTPECLEMGLAWQPEGFIKKVPEPAKGSATLLQVKITKAHQSPIKISLTAASALELNTLMPSHILPQIQALDIDLNRIETQLKEQGLEPQTLLDFTLAESHYQVWLE